MLTEKELRHLAKLDKARTHGEWCDIPHPEWSGANHRVAATSNELWTSFNQICYADSDDAAFIVACSRDVPKLLNDIKALRGVLERIANPLGYLQAEAKRLGHNLDGAMAVRICESAIWYQGEARKALEEKDDTNQG